MVPALVEPANQLHLCRNYRWLVRAHISRPLPAFTTPGILAAVSSAGPGGGRGVQRFSGFPVTDQPGERLDP